MNRKHGSSYLEIFIISVFPPLLTFNLQVIATDLEKKNTDLLAAFSSDLTDVSDLFHTYKDKPVVARNSAPHSGATAWARGLRERIEEPMSKVRDAGRWAIDQVTR